MKTYLALFFFGTIVLGSLDYTWENWSDIETKIKGHIYYDVKDGKPVKSKGWVK